MADSYKNSIKLGITLKPTSEVQSELNTAIEQLNKNSSIDLKIDTKQINQSLKDFSETLKNISNQIKNNSNFQGVFTNQASSVESVTNKLKEEQQVAEQTANVMKTLSTTITGKADSNGNITEVLKTVEQLQTGIGNTTRLTTDLATGLKTASNTENFQKLENIITNLQTKLNTTSKNNFINPSVITELQNKLNGINTNTAEKEFKELQSTINNLGSSDSQIVRLQSTISKMENTLTAMKGKYGSLVGDNSSREQLNSYTSQVEKLKTILASLQSGGTISGQKLASELNLGTNASRELSNAVKNSSNALKLAQTDASSFGSTLSKVLSNAGIYMGAYQAIQMMVTQMKNAYEYCSYMDKAFTDMNITMELTKQQFSDMSDKIQQMGVEYGNSSKTVMDIARVYANATTDLDTIMAKIKPDLWLANVSRMDGSQVTKTIQSMTNQFKLMSKEGMTAENATTRIGNSLVTVSKNMAYDFTAGIKELTEAVKTSGSVAQTSGQSMESYLSMAGAFIEQTGKSGDEFAQSYKMISARVLQQKELGNQLGISTDEMADAEQALSKYDISTRNTGGSLRNLDDILKDTSVKFATMSDSDKQFIANKLAGVRQTSSFIAIMDSMNRQQAIYNKTQTDTTSLYDAQQKYAQSLEGKLGSLKATYEGLLKSMLNSDFTKGMVEGLTSLIKNFVNLPTVIGLATTALLVFKGEAITSAVLSMRTMVISILAYESALAGTTITLGSVTGATTLLSYAMNTLKLAFVENPLGLLAIGITTAIIAFSALHKNMQETTDDIVSQSGKVKELNDGIEDLQTKSARLNELSSKTDLNTDERKELVKLNNDLASQYPELISYYDAENKSFVVNADALQKLIDKKRENAMMENALNLGDAKQQIEKYQKEVEDAENLLSSGKKTIVTHGVSTQIGISDGDKEKAIKQIQDANDNISKLSTTVNQGTKYINDYFSDFQKDGKSVNEATDALKKLGYTEKDINDALALSANKTKQDTDVKSQNVEKTKVLAEANKELQNSNNGLSADTISKITEAYPDVANNADKAKAKVDEFNNSLKDAHTKEIQDASDAYSKSAEEIAKAQGFLDKLNKAQAVTPAIASEVLKVYPELATQLGSVSSLQDALNAKIKEQQVSQSEAYLTMMQDDETFYKNKIANNDEFKNAYNNFLNDFVTNGEQADTVDFNNYKTYAEFKKGTQQELGVAIQNWLVSVVGESAKNYGIDFSNFKSYAEAKAKILEKLQADIKMVTEQMNNAISSAKKYSDEVANGDTSESGMSDDGKSFTLTDSEAKRRASANANYADSLSDKLGNLDTAYKKVSTSFDEFDGKIQRASVGGLGGNTDLSGTGGSGKKGKSGADEAKKAQEELVKNEKQMLTDIADAYNQAKDKIDDDINAIDTNLQLLGDADDSNFTKRVQYATDKIAKQKDEVTNAGDQLQKLKDTTVTTAEAQKELESATLKASKELRTQTLEASKLQKELEKTTQEEIKVTLEKQKEIDTETLEAQQKAQTDRLDAIKTAQETLHKDKKDALEAETKLLDEQSKKLDEQNTATERATELEKEKTDLLEKQKELANLEDQKTNQVYQKQADGTWNFVYVADSQKVSSKQKEVNDAQKTLDETNRKNALDDAKKVLEDKKSVIEAEKTAEDTAYDKKKSYLDKFSTDLKEAQDRDKKRIETHYSDIDTLSKDTLKQLETEYNNNWDAIAEHIATTLTATKKQLDDLTTLKANFTTTDADNAINSGDVSGYLEKNKSKMTDKAKVDENDINNNLKNIDISAKDANTSIDNLTESYKDLLSTKNDNKITDDDIKQNKKQISNITKIDYAGLEEQLKNLKEINAKIEKELDTHYNNELTRQNKAQTDEIESHDKFAKEYLLKTNKLCELLQVVWDFRFSNIVEIVDNAGVIISQALEAWSLAYQKFAIEWNTMNDKDHQIANKIEINDALSGIKGVHTTVVQWDTDKSKLYNQDTFEQFAKNIQGNIQDSLLNKLNNYSGTVGTTSSTSSSSVVNNNKNNTANSSTTNVNISQLDVNTKDAQNLLNQLLTIVQNKTNLS